jgi:hypothetical protein
MSEKDNVIYIDTKAKRNHWRNYLPYAKKRRTPGTKEHDELVLENIRKHLALQDQEMQSPKDMMSRELPKSSEESNLNSTQFADAPKIGEDGNVIHVDFKNKKRIK